MFCEDDKQYVLKALQPYTIYNLETQFEKLRNRILEIPNVIKPPVVKPLPERNRKCMFVSSPINIELWDKARWRGTAFLYYPNGGWFLGLLYSGNKNAAIEIFDEWKEYDDIDKHLEIVFIEGNINKLPPNGYTCLIQPNMSESINRIKSVNGDDETIVLTVSRFQRMYPKDNFLMYNKFKEIYYKNKGKPIPIVPVTIIDKKTDYRRKLMGVGQVVDFYYNDKAFSRKIGEVDKEKHIGLIYQSAIKMELSKFCHMEEDGYGSINYLSADYINLIAGALQQTIGIQEDIVQRVIRLEKENEELKCKLNRLSA